MAYSRRKATSSRRRAPARRASSRRAPARTRSAPRRAARAPARRTSQRQQTIRIVVEMPQSSGQFPAAMPVKAAPPPRKARF